MVDYADHMTKSVKVPKEVFARVRNVVADVSAGTSSEVNKEEAITRRVVEVTNTIAGYNMVTRMVMALDVGNMEGEEVPVPDSIQ